MAWCLTAPSHYLNQCWLIIISEAQLQSPEWNRRPHPHPHPHHHSCRKGGSQLDPAPGSHHADHFRPGFIKAATATTSCGIEFLDHCYALHGCVIWVSGCGVPLPDRQSASPPRNLGSWLGPWWRQRTSNGSLLSLSGFPQLWTNHWNSDLFQDHGKIIEFWNRHSFD